MINSCWRESGTDLRLKEWCSGSFFPWLLIFKYRFCHQPQITKISSAVFPLSPWQWQNWESSELSVVWWYIHWKCFFFFTLRLYQILAFYPFSLWSWTVKVKKKKGLLPCLKRFQESGSSFKSGFLSAVYYKVSEMFHFDTSLINEGLFMWKAPSPILFVVAFPYVLGTYKGWKR